MPRTALLCAAVLVLTGCAKANQPQRCEFERQRLESYELCLKTNGCILDGNDYANARLYERIACEGQRRE